LLPTGAEPQDSFPKLIHFIWLGPKPIPDTFVNFLLPQWRDKHLESSGYEIKIWGETDLESLDFLLHREVILDKDLNPALRADFLRLELLCKFGGLYADVDMTCERNVFEGLQSRFDTAKVGFVTGVSNTQAFEVNNGILLSKPGNTFTRHLIERLGRSIAKERKAVAALTTKENQLIQMLSLIDPAKAAQMKQSSQGHQLNVIRTSGPGFVTQTIFAYLSGLAQLPQAYTSQAQSPQADATQDGD